MKRKHILLFLLLMTAITVAANNGRIIDSEQYNKWASDQYYKQGIQALKDLDYDVAIEQLNKEMQQHPENGYAYVNLGQCLIEKAIVERAKTFSEEDADSPIEQESTALYLEKVGNGLEIMENGVKYLPAADKQSQCDTYMALSTGVDVLAVFDEVNASADSARSEKYLRKAVEVHPCYNSCMALMKRNYRSSGFNSVRDVIETFYNNCPENIKANYYMAALMNENGEYDKVISIIDNYVMKNNDGILDSEMLIMKSEALEKLGHHEDAVDVLLQVMANAQNVDPAYASERIVDLAIDHPDIVLMKIKQRAFANDNQSPVWTYLQALIYRYAIHDYPSSLKYYNELKKHGANVKELNKELAYCYYMNGDMENALLYSDAYDCLTGTSSLYNEMLLNQGNVDALISKISTMVSLKNVLYVDGDAYTNLARLYLYKRDYQQAECVLKEGLSLNDSLTLAHYLLGVVHKLQGKTDEARRCFTKVLDINGWDINSYRDIVPTACKIELGNTEDARQEIDLLATAWQKGKAAKTPTEELSSPVTAYEIACLYSMLGDNDHALEYLQNHFEYDSLPYNFGQMELDWRLDNIRSLPAYKQLVEKYRKPFNGKL